MAHAGPYLVPGQQRLVLVAGVLTAPVAVVDQASRRSAMGDCHLQGTEGQLFGEPGTDRPAHNAPGIQVDHHSQVEPAFASAHVGDVTHPGGIRPVDGEVPVQQVGHIWQHSGYTSRRLPLLLSLGDDAVLAHQTSNPVPAHLVTQGQQGPENPPIAITFVRFSMNLPNRCQQLLISQSTPARRTPTPGIIATGRDSHQAGRVAALEIDAGTASRTRISLFWGGENAHGLLRPVFWPDVRAPGE